MYSATYLRYLEGLHREADNLYEIAEKARRLGHDPKPFVEIPQASDLADRTQKLLSYLEPRKTAEQIRELTESFDGNRERVAIEIAKIVSAETFLYGKVEDCPTCEGRGEVGNNEKWMKECYDCHGSGTTVGFEEAISKTPYQETLTVFQERIKQGKLWTPDTPSQKLSEAAVYHGICAGLAVLTEGILVAPLEGVVSARFFKNGGKKHTLAVSYAGPIRSAGGSGQALSVLIADIVRRDFGLEKPIMSYDEVERYKEEVGMYRGLQYRPSNPQIEEMVNACPIYIDGEGVGNEVTGQRDLPRVKTNKVREGMLLVLCEGLTLKAPKILKYVDALNLDGWDFLRPFAKGSGGKKEGNKMPEIKPSTKFISDVLAGRPIFSQPMQEGGFRLRYGRSRLAGLATTSINPAVMKALSGFVIIGTQLKYERPGKGTVATPCDEIDGPYIQFKDGSGKMVNDYDELPFQYPTDPDYVIEKVWDLGELLVPVGEFLENNHVLIESPYVPEWHEQEVKDKGLKLPQNLTEVISFSKKHKIPIHPDYVAFYDNLSLEEFIQAVNDTNPATGQIKNKEWAYRMCIDVNSKGMLQGKKAQFWRTMCMGIDLSKTKGIESPLQFINQFFFVRPRITYRIGARMGKPEGSKMREMKPPVHTVFTVGHKVGSKRLVADAAKRTDAKQVGIFYCESCSEMTTKGVCPRCNKEALFDSVQWVGKEDELWEEVSIKNQWESAIEKVKVAEAKLPEVGFGVKSSKKILGANPQVKGVKGMTSKTKTNEHLAKGLLRFKNNISTFRDGTIRFDMVDITMTHFKPKEIGLTVEKARELGYDVKDEMESVPLFAQDVVLPTNCAEMMLNTANYIDDLLSTLYEVEPFYRCETKEDLVGHLLMGIAPHTSGAILGRIIGFADVKGHYGHPFFHAAKRRNCDGDEDAIMLLMDGLLNFSRDILPANRGGQMDAPLVLTTRLNPTEVDKEALNVDSGWFYERDFYEITQDCPHPKSLSNRVDFVERRLGSVAAVRGYGYTHDCASISAGPALSAYKTLDTMIDKMNGQLDLGHRLRAVDVRRVASSVIRSHFLPDLRGNLNAFARQKVRCLKCAHSYRRMPIAGKCIQETKASSAGFASMGIEKSEGDLCNGNLALTVSEGAVRKYIKVTLHVMEKYGVDTYTKQNVQWLANSTDSLFQNDRARQMTLSDFL